VQPGATPITRGRVFGGASAPKPADVLASTGSVAVQESKRAREQQSEERLKDEASSIVRRAGGKTFYLRDNVWTDSEFKTGSGLPETSLTFGSDEYFALLKQKPGLGVYFSLGERVIVVFEGRVYKINP
jgi:hypothetical protein